MSKHIAKTFFSFAFLLVITGTSSQTVQAGPILADSLADWNSATSDGIDVNGNAVAAGSSQDAAQQGHAASSNGIWNYKGTNGPATGTFSTSPGFFSNWVNDPNNAGNLGCYLGVNSCRMRSTTMAPSGTFNTNTYTVREWIGSGLAGETLRISGSFDTLSNTAPISQFNNGVQVLILLNNSIVLLDELIFPGGEVNFDIEASVLGSNPLIRFAVGPQGPGPAILGSSDFFNDSTAFSAQIELVTSSVPEPIPVILLSLGLIGLIKKRTGLKVGSIPRT